MEWSNEVCLPSYEKVLSNSQVYEVVVVDMMEYQMSSLVDPNMSYLMTVIIISITTQQCMYLYNETAPVLIGFDDVHYVLFVSDQDEIVLTEFYNEEVPAFS